LAESLGMSAAPAPGSRGGNGPAALPPPPRDGGVHL